MKLRKVTLQDFRSYHEAVTFNFGDGLTAVVGPNGAGKSSVIDALLWTLYGEARVPQGELVREGATTMRAEVEFALRESVHLVERRWHKGVTALDIRNGVRASSQAGTSIAATEAHIRGLIGSAPVALNTWLVTQGEGQRFLQAKPAERRAILGEALGISARWDALWDAAKVSTDAAATRLVKAAGDQARQQELASQLPASEAEVAQATEKSAYWAKQHEAMRRHAEGLHSKEMADQQQAFALAWRAYESAKRARQAHEMQVIYAQDAAKQALAALNTVEAQPLSGTCPQCGQAMPMDIMRATKARQVTRAKEDHNRALANLEKLGAPPVVPEEPRKPETDPALAQDIARTKQQLTDIGHEQQAQARILGAAQARVKLAQAAAEELPALTKLVEERTADLSHWQLTVQALGPQGARQLVLDQALSRIEAEANALLATVRPGTMLQMRTLSEKGRETLEVWVLDGSGLRRWETFSGGEKTRLMFATRVALSVTAAEAHGLGALPLFIFDESFGDQDEAGRQALLACLRALTGRVEQVIVVTHDDELAEQADQTVRVRKENGASCIV